MLWMAILAAGDAGERSVRMGVDTFLLKDLVPNLALAPRRSTPDARMA